MDEGIIEGGMDVKDSLRARYDRNGFSKLSPDNKSTAADDLVSSKRMQDQKKISGR